MLVNLCKIQQEIGEASDDAARKYYDETPIEDRTDGGVTAAMRAAAKLKHQSFKGQFFKYLSIANPKLGDKFLEEVSFPLITLLQDFLYFVYLIFTYVCFVSDHEALEQQWEVRDVFREATTHCHGFCRPSLQGEVASALEFKHPLPSSSPLPS